MSKVTQFLKDTYPDLAKESDETITRFAGDTYPELLGEDEEFQSDYRRLSKQTQPVKAGEIEAKEPEIGMTDENPTVRLDDSGKMFQAALRENPVLKAWADAYAGDDPEKKAAELKTKMEVTARGIEAINDQTQALKMTAGGDPAKVAAAEEFKRQAMKSIGVISLEETPATRLGGKLTGIRLTPEAVMDTTGAGEKVSKAVSGVQNAILDATEFFATPLGIATLGMGGLSAGAQKVIAGAFAVDMARHLPDQLLALTDAYKKGDIESAYRHGVGAVLTGIFMSKSAAHALPKTKAMQLREQLTESAKELDKAVKDPELDVTLKKLADLEALKGSLPEGRELKPVIEDKPPLVEVKEPVVTPRLLTKEEQAVESKALEESGEVGTPAPELGTAETVEPAALGSPGTSRMPSADIVQRDMRFSPEREVEGKMSTQGVLDQLGKLITVAGGDVPIRRGRFYQRALGIFKPREDVIRTLDLSDIPTAIHEVGHALQKHLYGTAYASGLRGLPPAVKRELVKMGRDLYGNRKPAAGYTGEGWAEYIRKRLTTDDYDAVAPETTKYVDSAVAKQFPEVLAELANTRKAVDIYRLQGAESLFREQTGRQTTGLAKLAQNTKEMFWDNFTFNWVEMFEPLQRVSEKAASEVSKNPDLAKKLGITDREGKLAPSADPFLLASWKRGQGGAVTRNMIERDMQDVWGNPTGGKPLRDILAPIKNRRAAFTEYAVALRAKEVWAAGKNPGLPLATAEQLISKHKSARFDDAIAGLQDYWEGVLKYVEQANPALKPLFDQFRSKYKYYMPLTKILNKEMRRSLSIGQRGQPLFRLRGTGGHLKIQDVFESTIENTAYLIGKAHRHMVEQAIVKLSKLPNMGRMIEGPLPKDRVHNSVSIDKIKGQLEEMGFDTGDISDGALLEWFDVAKSPKGGDPIITVLDEAGKIQWYELKDLRSFQALNGLEQMPLHWTLDLLLAMPARTFRLGTTGLRAGFSFVTNPQRDFQTWLLQTTTHSNLPKMTAQYFASMGEVLRESLLGKRGPYTDLFHRLGVSMGQPLGLDRAETRRASKGLFRGPVMRVVTNPIEHARDIFSITESVPRVAEMKLLAEEVGWKPGTPITPDQAVIIGLGGKRATVDFSASGALGRQVNQVVPFFNPSVQGFRSFSRSLFSKDPKLRAQTILRGVGLLTLPTLMNWFKNKDEDWYRNLPFRERYLFTHVNDGKNIWRIPRPFEWGNLFQVIPEALVDSWYQEDPEAVNAAFKHVFETTNPLDLPVALKVAKEQYNNWIDFWDRPIVPKGQIEGGILPGEQVGPYTSAFAEAIGAAFPEHVSPRRLDAAIRGFFGGAIPDLLNWIDSVSGRTKIKRDRELSDFPVFGRMWRRGGEFSANSKFINAFWDKYEELNTRRKSKYRPLTDHELAYFKELDKWKRLYFSPLGKIAPELASTREREAIYRKMANTAEKILSKAP